jgi:gas vesicle protein
MRIGKYESSESTSQIGTAVTFLLIGLGAGALTALLLAPKSGKQLRKDIRRKYEDAKDSFDEWKDEAKEAVEEARERGAELAEDLRERVAPLAKNLRRG